MRLGTILLIPALLGAQVPQTEKTLPWERLLEPAWRLEGAPDLGAVSPMAEAPIGTGPIRVDIRGDGAIRILDAKGLVMLHAGLPGRPLKAWRDGGIPLDLKKGTFRFPKESDLQKGLAALPLAQGEDFRPSLKGLLWILDDSERILTILHPSKGQVAHVLLPMGVRIDLLFRSDRLEVLSGGEAAPDRRERMVWSLPWMALVPQLLALATTPAGGTPGTALRPYPASGTE